MARAKAMLGILAWTTAFAQVPPPAPAFDIASVRIAKGDRLPGGYNHHISPLGLTMLHVSMGYCIRLAYGVQRSYELVAPPWIDPPTDIEYDIVAKVTNPATEDQIKLMLRTLLAERFQLAVHHEKRNLPAYTLVLAKNPPPLRHSDGQGPTKISPSGYDLHFENVSMSQLAQQLGPPMMSRPVVDRTGLSGTFDFSLNLARYLLDSETGKLIVDAKGQVDLERAALRGVREQLGLTVKLDRAPVDVLVVDRVSKVPAAN